MPNSQTSGKVAQMSNKGSASRHNESALSDGRPRTIVKLADPECDSQSNISLALPQIPVSPPDATNLAEDTN